VNLDYPRDVNDPFAETDPAKLAEYRAWAHRALDALIDFRLAWEAADADVDAPHFGGPSDNPQSDDRALELHNDVLMFASRIIGRRVGERNAETFDEGDLPGMRAALRRVVNKIQSAWPTAPVPVADSGVRRAILPRDLEDGLIRLDLGNTPDIFLKCEGRETDFIKERCRFAGALWSLRLEAIGARDFTARVVAAFNLGADGSKTVQRWKAALDDPAEYAVKLGFPHQSHVTTLISRAHLVIDGEPEEDFAWYLAWNVFGEAHGSLTSLQNIGDLFQALRQKSR
jgi:hypothetical protein